MKISSFTAQSLKPIIDEATVDGISPTEWAGEFLAGAANLVKSKPIVYRSFGPYWWSLKKHMQDAGLIDGEDVDENLFAEVTLGDIASDVAAAYAFHDITTKEMTAHLNTRTVQGIDGSIDYTLVDEEFEANIAGSSL